MILYDDRCTPCVRKQLYRELRAFARQHKLDITRIDLSKQPQYREEAEKYAKPLPFVVHNDVAVSLVHGELELLI